MDRDFGGGGAEGRITKTFSLHNNIMEFGAASCELSWGGGRGALLAWRHSIA